MWEDQEEEEEEEEEGLTGQLLSDILATNKYGEQSSSKLLKIICAGSGRPKPLVKVFYKPLSLCCLQM